MRLNNSHWLLSKPIAHRGLWGYEIVENTISAYKNAIINGYPIEIDVHMSLDGELFVYHDDNLSRLTNHNGEIQNMHSNDVKSLVLNGSLETIPTLKETLCVIDGKVPILLEIKNQKNSSIVERVLEEIKNYKGEIAVQSFNPLYIIKVKKLAPNVIRGILGTKEKLENKFQSFIVKNMPLNFLAKPDFISYRHCDLPINTKKPLICWTITSQVEYEKVKPFAKNIIFENFIPKQ